MLRISVYSTVLKNETATILLHKKTSLVYLQCRTEFGIYSVIPLSDIIQLDTICCSHTICRETGIRYPLIPYLESTYFVFTEIKTRT